MEVIKRIQSNSDNQHIDIVQQGNSFSLELYETKYDEEEGVNTQSEFFQTPQGNLKPKIWRLKKQNF